MANNKNKNRNRNRNKKRRKNRSAQAVQALNANVENATADQGADSNKKQLSEKDKYWNSFYSEVVEFLFCGSAMLLFIFYFFVRVNMVGLAATILLLAGLSDFFMRKRGKYIDSIPKRMLRDAVLYVLVISMVLVRSAFIYSKDVGRYGSYKLYLNITQDVDVFFPYELPKAIKKDTYRLINKNNAWGKSSWTSVRFCVETDSWEWARMVYEKGRNRENRWEETTYEGTLEECIAGNSATKNLRFLYDEEFWEGHMEGTIVMSDLNTGTDKKPESQVIIINPEEGMIEFSQLKKTILPF